MLVNLSRRELFLLALLILLGSAAAYYQFFYIPWHTEVNVLQKEIAANKEKLTELRAKENNEAQYADSIGAMEEEIQSIESRFVYSRDIPGILIDLYCMIIENNLEGTTVSFSNLNQGEKYDYFNVNFEVKGLSKDIDEFLRRIEAYNREVSIDSLELGQISANELRARLSIRYYVLKNIQPVDPADRYNFMEGNYGSTKSWYEMFKNFDK